MAEVTGRTYMHTITAIAMKRSRITVPPLLLLLLRLPLPLLLLLLSAWAAEPCHAQPPCTFTQYTSESGLAQKTVQDILQDHKGRLWMATWDGLYKFDGYAFKSYKARPGDNLGLSNNRIDCIKEDAYGYIWLQSYDHRVFRFDPRTESFQPALPDSCLAQELYVMPCGDVWITTRQNSLTRITTHPQTHEMTATDFFKTHHTACGERINQIYLDRKQEQWILTENGLYRLKTRRNEDNGNRRGRNGDNRDNGGEGRRDGDSGEEQLSAYFVAPAKAEKHPFYDALQAGDTTYFASAKGCVWLFCHGSFRLKAFPTRSSVKFIRQLEDGRLFVGTASDGFFVYDTRTDRSAHYNTATHPTLKDNHIREVYVDTHHEVWLRHNTPGVTHFNPRTAQTHYFILQDKYGKDIVDSRPEMYIWEDINGHLWLHPSGGGLAWYDRGHNRIRPFYNPALQSGWSNDNKVTALFTDRQGSLWLCSYGNGLEKVTFNRSPFHLLAAQPDDYEFPGNNTRAVFQDKEGNIWTGNKDKTIRVYDRHRKYKGSLSLQGELVPGNNDRLGIAYCFTQDHTGTIWIGTKGNGLMAATPTSTPSTYRLQRYTAQSEDPYSLSDNNVYSLYEDRWKRLWIATFGGGVNILHLDAHHDALPDAHPDTHQGSHQDAARAPRFINHRNRLKNFPIGQCYRTRFVTADTAGNIWIGSTTGLLTCDGHTTRPEDIGFRRFQRIPSDAGSLSNNDVHCIFATTTGELYISTFGGGLNRLLSLDNDGARFQAYTMKDGLSSDILLSMEEDQNGNLWLATEEGLCRFSPASGRIENYPAKAFTQRIGFNEGAALKTQDGTLMFNTVKGLLYFAPDSVNTNSYVPPIIFTALQQADQTVTPGPGSILHTDIDDTRRIELPHNRNSFSIQFAALDMKYPYSIAYAYRLDGFEKNWNYIGNQRTATYTNLPKGSYTLKVRSTNSDGMWVENTRTMAVTVLPSFWETPWAYLLYAVAMLTTICGAAYILFTIFRLKHKVETEQQISDIKLRFFTDISHELRTPLTLIAAPIEHILRNGHLAHEEKELLALVRKNTSRMLHLVNQILDFRKIQNNKMKMRVQQIEITAFTRHLMESFNSLARKHQIDFKLETRLPATTIWADADKLEKILFNLLSNAFKYTPEGKEIKVTLTEAGKEIAIGVQDQGVGIAESKQKSLFVRFESLADRNLFNQSSTGIGLSLVKELVEMHHGTISLKSKPGEGSLFTIRLPKGKEQFDEGTEFILSDTVVTDVSQVFQATPEALTHTGRDEEETDKEAEALTYTGRDEEETDKEKETILLVEDNSELRFFLRTIFAPYFNVAEAENGADGLEKSKRCQPDIIVSDVMMPVMDGIEMVQALRREMTTSHIPIVLLTAKSTTESKIESMHMGADDYITKPFSAAYLKARVFNLIEQRKKLQALYCASLLPTAAERQSAKEPEQEPALSPNDRRFMDQVMQTIEQNMDNGSLTVEILASGASMSRSVFFKKLKSLTGLSPIEFVREIRMKRAAQLIETEEYNMAQIAYMTGFNDSHYFSKCFKQHYGITPTEYKNAGTSRPSDA